MMKIFIFWRTCKNCCLWLEVTRSRSNVVDTGVSVKWHLKHISFYHYFKYCVFPFFYISCLMLLCACPSQCRGTWPLIYLFFHSCFTPYIHCGWDVDNLSWLQVQILRLLSEATVLTATPPCRPRKSNKDVLHSVDVYASPDDFCFFTFVHCANRTRGRRHSSKLLKAQHYVQFVANIYISK